MKKIQILIFLLVLFLSNFCSRVDNVQKIDNGKQGSKYPKRIVSLGPSITKGLFLIGVERRIIANTNYCIFPEQAKRIEKIGNLINFNIERIVQLKPDLIIATPMANLKKIEKLSRLHIPVKVLPTPENYAEIVQNFLDLGRMLGKEKKTEEIVNRNYKMLKFYSNAIKDLPRKKVFFQIGIKPLFTVNSNYHIHDCIIRSGAINIAEKSKTGLYSFESVVYEHPDIIIIASMGFSGEEEKKIWYKYKSIKAVKEKKVFVVDANKFYLPLPGSFVESVAELIKIIHPGISIPQTVK